MEFEQAEPTYVTFLKSHAPLTHITASYVMQSAHALLCRRKCVLFDLDPNGRGTHDYAKASNRYTPTITLCYITRASDRDGDGRARARLWQSLHLPGGRLLVNTLLNIEKPVCGTRITSLHHGDRNGKSPAGPTTVLELRPSVKGHVGGWGPAAARSVNDRSLSHTEFHW
ncbi:hypothetical protein EVAR_27123_1 [Eumeta japonica]|uniref:Uncharacterized protein n=1 Tax=Eumeta variegata TaxID=151549 RepID=A0A4C1W1M1_EUMVA|nr:hypothetical protein EVAR_27123_1 [Eumeta japonica]